MKAILVLDDDTMAGAAVVDLLRDAGFDALAAAVDVRSLEVVARAPELVGLILLDAAARQSAGPEFMEMLRRTFPCSPIVGESDH